MQARHAQLENNANFGLIAIKGATVCLGSLFDWTDISMLTGCNYLAAYEERPNKGRSLCDADYSRDIWIGLDGPIERDPRNEHKQGSGHGRGPCTRVQPAASPRCTHRERSVRDGNRS